MLFMGWRRGYVPSHVRGGKMRYQGGQKCGCQKSRGVDREGAPQVARMPRSTRLLHIDEEVALQNVLPFFVLLGLFVRLVLRTKRKEFREQKAKMEADGDAHIFPAEYGTALTAINVSHGVVACSHLTVIRFAFDNVDPAHIHPISTGTT